MGEPARRPATYQDILSLPDHVIGEIIEGVLHTSPRPAPRHSRAATTIIGILHSPFDRGAGGPGGWWILDEPELHLDADIVVPDLAGWRRERLPRLPDEAYHTLAPDWVCEVISPSTEQVDRIKKKRIYSRAGVEWYWLVHPVAQTLEVLQRAGSMWQEIDLFSGDEIVRARPFRDIEIPLSEWWNVG
jgi:Uma2 family endonuclease